MESKLVEYARAVVEDAVDVDADFFKNSEMQCLSSNYAVTTSLYYWSCYF